MPRLPGAVYPSRRDSFSGTVRVGTAGLHSIYVGGAFRRRLEVTVDGRRVWSGRHQLSHAGYHEPIGRVGLTAGRQVPHVAVE